MSNLPKSGYIKSYSKPTISPQQQNVQSRSTEDQAVINAIVSKANATEVENWKDIKPERNYMDIKKKAFIDQKKREYQDIRNAQNQSKAEYKNLPYQKSKGGYYNQDLQKKQRVSNQSASEHFKRAVANANSKRGSVFVDDDGANSK